MRRGVISLLSFLVLLYHQFQPGRVVPCQLPQLTHQQAGKPKERQRDDEEETSNEEKPGPPSTDPARITGRQFEINCVEGEEINIVL